MKTALLDSTTRFTSSDLDDGVVEFVAAWCQYVNKFTSFEDTPILLLLSNASQRCDTLDQCMIEFGPLV